ncbi:uncharacterized protein LOC123542587 isoform X2 [Mercenaria mercenaria]|uniref:uncharacterized protein LOC123542587 isoform X2 n=1 Tax=Mercenaria mercenaria TaxID=6596 RepID=UPI00234E6C07|nr:uncharacterized protein LOC123542587 isoform X2 [Mercenaria mercenaria]
MATAKLVADNIKMFVNKYDENHHEIESEFKKLKLDKYLCNSDIQTYTTEECSEVITELDNALCVVEGKSKDHILYTLFTARDRVQKAQIGALKWQLKHCTCKAGDLMLRKDQKRTHTGKGQLDSGYNSICLTDSRLYTETLT